MRAALIAASLPALVAVIALALRLPGLFTDLWLDEILSLVLLEGLESPFDVFTEIHFDTNHWLYSFWLYFCGPSAADWIFRLPAFVAGLATVLVFAVAGRRLGLRQHTLAAAIAAVSFPLVFYSTEARGYAFLVFFALAAFVTLDAAEQRPALAPVYWLAACSGILSHLTFLVVLAGLALLTIARRAASSLDVRSIVLPVARLHAAPALVFAALYWVDIRFMGHAGADPIPLARVVADIAAGALGLPRSGTPAALALLVAAAIGITGLALLAKANDRNWVFFAAVLVVVPAALVLARPDFRHWTPRHFLVAVPFFLLLFSRVVEWLLAASRATAALGIALLVLFGVGNIASTARFLDEGRGHYFEALQYVARASHRRPPVLGSDHDFRNLMLIQHYTRRLPAGTRIVYCRAGDCPQARPEWYIVHDTSESPAPHPEVIQLPALGASYRLEKHFGFSGWSGWHWYLYRRDADLR